MKVNLDKYGLGKKRTLKQYYDYTGIDKDKKIVTTNFCRPDNKATEEDIKQSNEKNHVKEGFTFYTNPLFTGIEIFGLVMAGLAIILLILFLLKKLKNLKSK